MTKAEILRQVRTLLNNIKRMVSHGKFIDGEVKELENILDEIEKEYAYLVDNYMALEIAARNQETGNAKRDKSA